MSIIEKAVQFYKKVQSNEYESDLRINEHYF